MNKGQGLVEYALILFMVAIVVICIMALVVSAFNQSPCDSTSATAGNMVDCIATRTAEAKHR